MKNVHDLFLVFALLLGGCSSVPSIATNPASTPEQGTQRPMLVAAPTQTPQVAPSANEPVAPAPAKPSVASRSPISADALGIYRTPEERQKPPTEDELAVIASAKSLLGKPPNAKVTVNDRSFTLDCIGTVSAVFYKLWIDVQKDFALYSGDGVTRLYKTLKERNVLHKDTCPRPGDVVIWDNTWDAKGNGDRVHVPRTHAGIVLAVDEDGTIHYVHENLYKGIVVETMNLLRPTVARDEQGKLINSGMAIPTTAGGPRPVHWLAGDVFNAFGDVLGLKSYFLLEQAQLDGDRQASAKVALTGN
jgi:cell wall-associated NlpC family hydrolase